MTLIHLFQRGEPHVSVCMGDLWKGIFPLEYFAYLLEFPCLHSTLEAQEKLAIKAAVLYQEFIIKEGRVPTFIMNSWLYI